MIDNGGAVRIGIERPVSAAMPDEPRRRIADITPVIAIRLRSGMVSVSSQAPRKMMQQFVPPKPKALERASS